MKKTLITLVILLIVCATPVFAAMVTKTWTGTWTFDAAQQPNIQGFRIYNQEGKVLLDNIAPNLRTASAPITYDDTVIQAFYMVAFGTEGRVSNPSNMIIFKPALGIIQGVGTFEFKIQ